MAVAKQHSQLTAYNPKRPQKAIRTLSIPKKRVKSQSLIKHRRVSKRNKSIQRPVSFSINVPAPTAPPPPSLGEFMYGNNPQLIAHFPQLESPPPQTLKTTLPSILIYMAIGAALRLLQR
ncbi:hypothetical protein DAPK24_008980 [Pichia kluyveri]|uniref:Uncharacterized protein n=1 Tax=Pichia kluyveri TaxID=36015 RepID=A0AAV5QZZ3_PICKL|nr:hypothetical protein DAPK24_008980 [Pichia kluyveri]